MGWQQRAGTVTRAHFYLHCFNDGRKKVVLTVFGQKVLTGPAEGEELVVKCLEVGLASDQALP